MLKIIVKNSRSDEIREYFLDPLGKISDLKEKISKDIYHSIQSLILKYNDEVLNDNESLNSLDIPNNEIELIIKDLISLKMETKLEMFTSINNYIFTVSKNDSIFKLKEQLSKNLNISNQIINLKCNDVILENFKTFNDYLITDNCFITFELIIHILEMNKFDNQKCNVINKFFDKSIKVNDVVLEYCQNNDIKYENVRLEFNKIRLSNENILDLIKNSDKPIFELKFSVRVLIVDPRNQTTEIDMFLDDKILELRYKINKENIVLESHEKLIFNNVILEDDKYLQFYGVKDLCKIFVGFLFNIRSDDTTVNLPECFVHVNSSIIDVKRYISQQINLDETFINFLIGLDELDNTRSIGSYNITESTEVELKIGIKILLFVLDDVIEYFLQQNTQLLEIRQCISFKKNISPKYIKMLFNEMELTDNIELSELAKSNPDLIINVKPKIVIHVKDQCNKITSYDIWENMTVFDVKELIFLNSRILKEKMNLKFNNTDLQDDKTIDFYEISDGMTIEMFIEDRVTIIDENDNLYVIYIEPVDSITTLKNLLSFKIKININEIHLYLDNIYLENYLTIDQCQINIDSLLLLKIGTRIRLVTESELELQVITSRNKTIGHLKELIFIEYEIDINQSSFYHDGKELSDNENIGNLNLTLCPVLRIISRSLTYDPIQKLPENDHIMIYVCNLTNKYKDFIIKSVFIFINWSVMDLKMNLFPNRSVDVKSLVISYLGDPLDDDKQLIQCGIREQKVVMLKLKSCHCEPSSENLVIIIKRVKQSDCPDNERIHKYLVEDYQTVYNLKQRLRDELNIPIDNIKLMFGSNILHNEESLRMLDIESETTLLMDIIQNQSNDNTESIDNIIKISIKYVLLSQEISDTNEIVEIDRNEPVSSLKEMVANQLSINKSEFVMEFCNEIILEKNSIVSYNLINGSEVSICNSILVKQFSGQGDTTTVRRFPIKSTDTVKDLKYRIAKKQNIQISFIKLNFQGDYLEDECLLRDAEIENESFIMMITTLKGGL